MLVLVAVLPLLIFGGGVAWMIVAQKKKALADELGSTTRALSVAVDHKLASQIEAIEVLATANSLNADRLADFQERAQRAIAVNRDWLNVGLIDPRSHQIIVGSPPVLHPPQTSLAPSHVDEVVRTRKPVIVGTFTSSKITQGPIILLLIPVIHNDAVRYVLGVAVNPKALSGLFVGQQFPPSWTGAIVDTNMRVAGRSRDPETYIGMRVSPALARSMAASERGMFSSVNLEGTTVYTVYSRSSVTNWSVAIGVPAHEVDGPIQRILLQLAAAGGTLIAFALILTGLVGRSIVRRRNAYELALQEGQSQLTERMQQLNTILDNSSVGITFVRDRRQILSNRRMSDMLGYSAQQMDNQSTRMFYASQEAFEELGQKGYDCLVRGERYTTEQEMRCKDGSFIWMRISGSLIANKNPASGSIWVFEDINERKRTEEKLRDSERSFRTLFEKNSSVMLLIEPASGAIIDANAAAASFYGYSASQLREMNISAINTLQPECIAKERQQALHTLHNYFISPHRLVSGEIRTVEVHSTPIAVGHSTLLFSIIHDVTQRVRDEQQLDNLMREQKAILDSHILGVCKVKDRKFVWANAAFAVMLGYAVDELKGLPTRIIYPSDQAYAAFGEATYPFIQGGEISRTEVQYQRKDGSLGWYDISGGLISPGSTDSIWALVDITERQLAEQQLRIAATAFEAQEGMVVTDADNLILRVNRAFTEITGYTAEDVVGRPISLLKSGHHDAAFYTQMWQSLREQGTWQGEIWNRRKNGEVYPQWLTITAVKDSVGAVAQYVATLTDITLRKAAEDEVRQLAFYDPLTQLPNRRLLLNRLQQAVVVRAFSS